MMSHIGAAVSRVLASLYQAFRYPAIAVIAADRSAMIARDRPFSSSCYAFLRASYAMSIGS